MSPNPDASADTQSQKLLTWLITLGLLIGMACCAGLWRTREFLPNLPVADWLPQVPRPWDLALISLTVACLLMAPLMEKLRKPALVLLLALCALDQLRWQPWVYQYMLGLTALYLAPRAARSTLLGLLTVAVYFWSGVYKLGPGFQTLHAEVFTQPLLGKIPAWAYDSLLASGKAAPWLEIGFAALLLFPGKLRRLGVIGLIAMHAYILVNLGWVAALPNTVVWPWNLCMVGILLCLFWKKTPFHWSSLLAPAALPATAAAAVLLVAGPILARSESWDRYLSFQLYSGRDRRGMMVMDRLAFTGLPAEIQAACQKSAVDPALQELRLFEWCLRETNVPPPGEPRILLALARHVGRYKRPTGSEMSFYTDYHFLRKENGWDMFSMADVQRMETLPVKLRQRFP
jgi:hypothetical protein